MYGILRTDEPIIYTLPYDSDHQAIVAIMVHKRCNIQELHPDNWQTNTNLHRTDWTIFKKDLVNKSLKILADKFNQIKNKQVHRNTSMNSALKKNTPRKNERNYTNSFQNREIRRLQCQKSKLVTSLFKIYRSNRQPTPENCLRTITIKKTIENQALKTIYTAQTNKI